MSGDAENFGAAFVEIEAGEDSVVVAANVDPIGVVHAGDLIDTVGAEHLAEVFRSTDGSGLGFAGLGRECAGTFGEFLEELIE